MKHQKNKSCFHTYKAPRKLWNSHQTTRNGNTMTTITKFQLRQMIKEIILEEQLSSQPKYKFVVITTERVFNDDPDDYDSDGYDFVSKPQVTKTKKLNAIARRFNYIRSNTQWYANMKVYDPGGNLIAKFNREPGGKVTEDSGPLSY
jgi:hypothetical protein